MRKLFDHAIIALICACMVIICVSCGSAESGKQALAEKAVRSLRKIRAATQVGVTLTGYRGFLVEAQADVSEADRALPGTLIAFRLTAAMKDYVDAAEMWEAKLSGKEYFLNDPVGKKMIEEYAGLRSISAGGPPSTSPSAKLFLQADPAVGMRRAWEFADFHLDDADKIAKRKGIFAPRPGGSQHNGN